MFAGLLVGSASRSCCRSSPRCARRAPEPLAALVTCALIVGLGLVDDVRRRQRPHEAHRADLHRRRAGAARRAAAVLRDPRAWASSSSSAADLAVPLTILWVVAIANAVNLVDGLDGLAAAWWRSPRGAFFVYMVAAPRASSATPRRPPCSSAITVGVCVGLPAVELPPGEDLHGRLGRDAARACCSRSRRSRVSAATRSRRAAATSPSIAIPMLVPLLVLSIPFLDVVARGGPAGAPRTAASARPTRSTSTTG